MQRQRLRIKVRGVVQGVGFRPFAFRLARALSLGGWVTNDRSGVVIEVEGRPRDLSAFQQGLRQRAPAAARIDIMDSAEIVPLDDSIFKLRDSEYRGPGSPCALPDAATCPACLSELFDRGDRRYRYPFISCCECGPRYSILTALPFDRERTAMDRFPLCATCRAEYENPDDRRFHAQTLACPACGPRLSLLDAGGNGLARDEGAVAEAVAALQRGAIVALKGIGGFQLLVNARDEAAVAELRRRKVRPAKPFAVMFPDLKAVAAVCALSPLEAERLSSPQAPIVLVALRRAPVAPNIAPGSPCFGVLLPYSPVHHLLTADLGGPLVATSGNLSGEPICIDEHEALERLAAVADVFLVHDRPILRPLDDSVERVIGGRPMVIRRARGYAPMPLMLPRKTRPVLALGGHLKNCVAAAEGERVILSQHIGDLDSERARKGFENAVGELKSLYGIRPEAVAADLHPDYAGSRLAAASGLPVCRVQHHYAHILACMAEHGLEAPCFGIAWDGIGLGTDRALWGGEFLSIHRKGWRRMAHFLPFPLPGGEKAIREPRRCALGALYAALGDSLFENAALPPLASFAESERGVLRTMLARGVNSPLTSSVGRLFDAVAGTAGLCQVSSFEGQAAMALEAALQGHGAEGAYGFALEDGTDGCLVVDWRPMMRRLAEEALAGVPAGLLALRFHNTLAKIIVTVAERQMQKRVVLSGGCFQNRYLSERAIARLTEAGFQAFWHRQVPCNDGGLALGQVYAAAREWGEN